MREGVQLQGAAHHMTMTPLLGPAPAVGRESIGRCQGGGIHTPSLFSPISNRK